MPSPYRFIVSEVFRLKGRGTAVVGGRPTDRDFRHGDVVEILRDGVNVLTTPAWFHLDVRKDGSSLVLPDVEAGVRPGGELLAQKV